MEAKIRREETTKKYYVLDDSNGYGSECPVCVDEEEKQRLIDAGWSVDGWHIADREELALFGIYDGEE